jgi:VanZ family protein
MKKVPALLPAVLYYALIFYLSDQPHVRIPISFPLIDKILHTVLYAGFGLCLSFALARFDRKTAAPRYALLILLGLVLGGLDEFHQSFVPGRSPDPADAAADVLGVLIGGMAYRRLSRTAFGRSRPGLFPPPEKSEADPPGI